MDQISCNLLKKAFATWQHAFLSSSVVLYNNFCSGMRRNQNFDLEEKMTYVFYQALHFLNFFLCPFFFLSFCCSDFAFSFSYLFAAVIDLLLGLLKFPFKNYFQYSIIKKGNFCHRVAMCSGRKFCRVFLSNFWAFSGILQAPLSWSLWSGYHWKYLFLLQKLSIDDANFGQRWWRQKWNKA